MNNVICISGPSGVGKTTVSKLLTIVCNPAETLVLSGDDLHKWERNDVNWQRFTHLHPHANKLGLGVKHLKALKEGNSIERQLYEHSTGMFTPLQRILPKKNIIYEGLHTLFLEESRNMADVSIYVETDYELKKEWKLKRDIYKRGYTIEEVLRALQSRQIDEIEFIHPQKEYADIIINFQKIDNKICFEYETKKKQLIPLMERITRIYEQHHDFFEVSKLLSIPKNELVQNKGGNMSFKHEDTIIITSSGAQFKNITMGNGYTYCNIETGKNIFNSNKIPSMEMKIHALLDYKCVLHTHPLYVLAVLCAKEAEAIIHSLFDSTVGFLKYSSPGLELSKNFPKNKDIIFLKNHGIFVCDDTLIKCYEKTYYINSVCKKFIQKRLNDETYLFPDAVVLRNENAEMNINLKYLITRAGLTEDPLSAEECDKLLNMEEEKFRRKK